MITDPALAPRDYEHATENNPLRFGLNSIHDGYWYTVCDGMPTLMGCNAEIRTSRPYVKASRKLKPSGWLICYGKNEDNTEDKKIILAFCPACAKVVQEQERKHLS